MNVVKGRVSSLQSIEWNLCTHYTGARLTKKLLIDHCPAIVPDTTWSPRKERRTLRGGVYIRRNLSSDNRLTVCYIYIYRYIATSCMEGFPISQSLSLLSSFLFSLFMYVKNFLKKKRKRECFLNWCKITTSFTLIEIESCDTEHVRDRQTAFALIAVREKGPTAGVPSWTDWKKKEDRSRNPIRMPSGTI